MATMWWPEAAEYNEFLAPAVIVSGQGSSSRVPELLQSRLRISGGTILVVVDDIVLDAGLAAGLLKGLEDSGFRVVVSSGFGAEPADTVVDAAAERAREANADAVIGIGGGSVLDSSKLLALLLRNEGRTADWLGVVEPPQGVAPLVLIPTTCGTGAEATRIAMVTVDGSKRAASCALFVPTAVVIDPEMVKTLPGGVIASTAMDALAHAVESLMSTARSPMSAHHALRAIDLLVGSIEAAVNGDSDALARCHWASHLAGQALNAGVVLGHSLAYCIAHEHPMPHGTSCALALPYTIAYNQSIDPDLGRLIAEGLTQGRSTSLRDAAQEVKDLAARIGLPTTLAETSIPASAARELAERCMREYPRPTNPVAFDADRLTALVESMRTGDLEASFAVAG